MTPSDRHERRAEFKPVLHLDRNLTSPLFAALTNPGPRSWSGQAVSKIASRLRASVFPPGELCPPGFLYIVTKGIALRGRRMY